MYLGCNKLKSITIPDSITSIGEGLIRGWGLSQVDVDVIDAAQTVTPLTAIQNIYSMVERDNEKSIIPYGM